MHWNWLVILSFCLRQHFNDHDFYTGVDSQCVTKCSVGFDIEEGDSTRTCLPGGELVNTSFGLAI